MDLEPAMPAIIAGGAVIMAAAIALGGSMLGHLYARVSRLEDGLHAVEADNRKLHGLFQLAVSFINRVGLWVSTGGDPDRRPEPPDQLREHIDAGPWGPASEET